MSTLLTRREAAVRLSKLARCDERIAELHAELAEVSAERARLSRELAENDRDPQTGRKTPIRADPEIPAPNDVTRAAARAALRHNGLRRRLGA